MWRMRQRILPVEDTGRSQDPAHGRISAQMSGMQQILQPALESQDSPTHPHGH